VEEEMEIISLANQAPLATEIYPSSQYNTNKAAKQMAQTNQKRLLSRFFVPSMLQKIPEAC